MFATKIYTVHVKPGESAASGQAVFVREGFNIFAFMLPLIWTLYKRLWLMALAMAAFDLFMLITGKAHMLNPLSSIALDLGFHIWVGFEANDWLRARLARTGYALADITAGDNKLRAEQRYFERYLGSAA